MYAYRPPRLDFNPWWWQWQLSNSTFLLLLLFWFVHELSQPFWLNHIFICKVLPSIKLLLVYRLNAIMSTSTISSSAIKPWTWLYSDTFFPSTGQPNDPMMFKHLHITCHWCQICNSDRRLNSQLRQASSSQEFLNMWMIWAVKYSRVK